MMRQTGLAITLVTAGLLLSGCAAIVVGAMAGGAAVGTSFALEGGTETAEAAVPAPAGEPVALEPAAFEAEPAAEPEPLVVAQPVIVSQPVESVPLD